MTHTMIGIGLSFGAGIALGESVARGIGAPIWLAAAGGCFGIALLARRFGRVMRVAAFVAVGLLGFVRAASIAPFPEWLILRVPELHELTGIVASTPEIGADRIGFVLAPDGLPGRLDMTWFEPPRPIGVVHRGDRVTVIGRARVPEAFDGFDYPRYLARRGIFATMVLEGEAGLRVESSAGTIVGTGDRIRQAVIGAFSERLSPELLAMAQSLLFGDRSSLPSDLEDAFSRTGLMHLLAVSGLHLGIFLAGIWWGLRALGLRPRITYPLVGVLVLGVLWIVGPRVSLVRAALLFAFLGLGSVLADLGFILRRWVNPLNALASTSIAILAMHPGALFEAGFQLTIAATASILIAFAAESGWASRLLAGANGTRGWGRLRGNVVRLFLVAVAAQAGATPIIAWHFGAIHPVSVLANVVVVPLAGLSLWGGLAGSMLLAVGAGGWAIAPFGWLLMALRSIVAGLARVPLSAIPVPRWMALWTGAMVAFAVTTAAYVSSSDPLSWTSKSTSMVSESPVSDGADVNRPPRSA